MMAAMENDIREGGWYVNPVFLMAHSVHEVVLNKFASWPVCVV